MAWNPETDSWAPGEPPVGDASILATDTHDTPPVKGAVPQQPNFMSDIDAKSDALQHSLVGPAQEAQKNQTAADRQRDDNTKKDRERMDIAWGNETARAGDPALEVWDADKEKANRTRGPMEQFGSVGFIFAMAASAFTRTPMTSALNAGAAAMTAIQQGDEKAYEHAYKAWKDNSDLAIRRFDMEHRLYEDADKLLTTDMNLWKQKTLEIASQFGHEKEIAMLNAGLDPEVLKSREALIKSKVEIQKYQHNFEEFEAQRKMVSEGIKALRQVHKDWTDDNKSPEQMVAESEVYARAVRAVKGQVSETPEQRLERMMAITQAQGTLRSAEGDKNRKAAMDRLVATLGSREQIAEMSDERIRELAGNQIDARERLEQERATARASEGDKNRALREKISTMARSGGAKTLSAEKVDVIEKAKAEFRSANDGREPNSSETKDIITKATTGSDKPTISDETATYMAKQYMSGDKSVFQNLGRGMQGAANLVFLREKVMELAKKDNVSPTELATRMAEFSGLLAAERTLGTRTANVEMFNNEAINMMSIARQVSHEFPRTQFPIINKAIVAYEEHTGDPKVREFGAAINEVVNTYSKAINGGSAGTVHDKENARDLLKKADTPEQFDAILNIMEKGLQQARRAPGQVRQELRDLSGGGSTLERGKVPEKEVKAPPIDLLKEGVLTTFSNGSKWTLQNGKPVQVGQ